MNAQVKPVPLPIQRPQYARWDLVRQNDEPEWIAANMSALRDYWRALGGGSWEPEAEFTIWCRTQWDIERMHYEQLKADGFDDPYAREDS